MSDPEPKPNQPTVIVGGVGVTTAEALGVRVHREMYMCGSVIIDCTLQPNAPSLSDEVLKQIMQNLPDDTELQVCRKCKGAKYGKRSEPCTYCHGRGKL